MIRHASPAKPVGALAQSMTESTSLRLLVPTVGGVSLLAARLLSAGGAAEALSTITQAADPKETATSGCATKSHSENNFGPHVSLRMAHDVTVHESMIRCAPAAQILILFSIFSGEKFRKLQIQMIDDTNNRAIASVHYPKQNLEPFAHLSSRNAFPRPFR
jgi:hypothetical protein